MKGERPAFKPVICKQQSSDKTGVCRLPPASSQTCKPNTARSAYGRPIQRARSQCPRANQRSSPEHFGQSGVRIGLNVNNTLIARFEFSRGKARFAVILLYFQQFQRHVNKLQIACTWVPVLQLLAVNTIPGTRSQKITNYRVLVYNLFTLLMCQRVPCTRVGIYDDIEAVGSHMSIYS